MNNPDEDLLQALEHAVEQVRRLRDTVWAKTKAVVAKAGGASLPMVIEVASSFVKEQLGLK